VTKDNKEAAYPDLYSMGTNGALLGDRVEGEKGSVNRCGPSAATTFTIHQAQSGFPSEYTSPSKFPIHFLQNSAHIKSIKSILRQATALLS